MMVKKEEKEVERTMERDRGERNKRGQTSGQTDRKSERGDIFCARAVGQAHPDTMRPEMCSS